jgi:hypothetical protein
MVTKAYFSDFSYTCQLSQLSPPTLMVLTLSFRVQFLPIITTKTHSFRQCVNLFTVLRKQKKKSTLNIRFMCLDLYLFALSLSDCIVIYVTNFLLQKRKKNTLEKCSLSLFVFMYMCVRVCLGSGKTPCTSLKISSRFH